MSECNDVNCPIHGNLKVRGNVFVGKVISAKNAKSVTVERVLVKYLAKFERYKKSRSKIYAHKPDCMKVKEGDMVEAGETRKLSKTKSFVVTKVLSKEEAKK